MALNNFIGKRKWKTQFEAGREAADAGDYVTAEASLRSALDHAVNISERDSSFGDTALLLGQVYRRIERYDEADDMSKRAFDYYESVFGVTDPRTVQAHLAIVLALPERSHKDLDVRKATFELARAQFGVKSWQAVRTAALALPSFSSQERETVLADVRSACASVLAEDRMLLAHWPPVAEEFAQALFECGYHDLAARLQGSQLKMNEERFGPKSQEAALARIRLGEYFLEIGHPEKAEIAFVKAIDNIKLKLGPRSEPVQRATVALAKALARQKKLQAASPYLTEALVSLRSNQVVERVEVLVALLEFKCLSAGTDSERGALWQELESFWERSEDDSAREGIFRGLISAQNRLQQAWEYSAADRLLHVVLARVRQWRGPHHPDVAEVLMELCSCSIGSDERSRAHSFLEQSLALDETVDNLIRAVMNYAKLGDWVKAKQYANQAKRLLNTYSPSIDKGRREALLAQALLACGEDRLAETQAVSAQALLPENEHLASQAILAQVKVLQGDWSQAVTLFRQCAAKLTDPYSVAVNSLQLAWVLTQCGQFSEAKLALKDTEALLQLRSDHPVGFQVKAVLSQIAFYSGNVYEGKELRKDVFTYIDSRAHKHTLRSLSILVLVDPFGPDEGEEELDLGTQILGVSNYPEGAVYAFPVKDVACAGLRHVTRALEFQEQRELAKERLSQFRERFFSLYGEANPVASMVFLVASSVEDSLADKCAALEKAVQGLHALSERHIALFPSLNRLAKLQIKLGQTSKARSTCKWALEMRQTSTLLEWMSFLEKDQLPVLESSPEAAAESPPLALSLEEEPPAEVPEQVSEEILEEVSEESSEEISEEVSEEGSLEIPVLSEASTPSLERASSEEIAAQTPRPEHPTEEVPAPPLVLGGVSDLADLQLARFLSERAEPPNPAEMVEFLDEVKARFGEEPQPHLEARVLLALLFDDGAKEASELWAEALSLIDEDDAQAIFSLENRARDASSWSLVMQTLQERLRRESLRFGHNSVDTLDTQMKLARALEAAGHLADAYHRMTLVSEILRSWFGARSRRLLEPLAELIRMAEALSDVQAAFEHQLERHHILESVEGDAEDLFKSRISLLPLRARLGQMNELSAETQLCEKELLGFRKSAASEFARVLIVAAKRSDQVHWRSDVAFTLLETALRVIPQGEISLGCAVRVLLAESQYRKDYKAQASRVRQEALDMAANLDSESRAELFHMAAQSCLRTGDLVVARAVAERLLEERIAEAGRKDLWAGRALLVLAEADLKTFRLEGTETAIGMSAPSLRGTRYWAKAQALKLQALFFLGRYEEAFALLEGLPEEVAFDLELKSAVWRGLTSRYLGQLHDGKDKFLAKTWADFENVPLGLAVSVLEFFARAGQVGLLAEGMTRLWKRATAVPATDVRYARLKVLGAKLQFWDLDWQEAASTLQQALELVPQGTIEFPDGLTSSQIRGFLISCLLHDGRSTSAFGQAQQGAAESAELLGEEDVRAVAFRINLAQCARALGQQEDALDLLEEIDTQLQELLGGTHVLVAEVFQAFATTFLDQGDIDSARLSAEEALRIDKECRGLSVHLLQDLELLADIEGDEDISESVNLLEKAHELAGQVLPKDHPYTIQLLQKRERLSALESEATPPPEAELLSPEEIAERPPEAETLGDDEDGELLEAENVDSADSLFVESLEPEGGPAERAGENPDSDSEESVSTLEALFEIPAVGEEPEVDQTLGKEGTKLDSQEEAESGPDPDSEEIAETEDSLEQLFAIDEIGSSFEPVDEQAEVQSPPDEEEDDSLESADVLFSFEDSQDLSSLDPEGEQAQREEASSEEDFVEEEELAGDEDQEEAPDEEAPDEEASAEEVTEQAEEVTVKARTVSSLFDELEDSEEPLEEADQEGEDQGLEAKEPFTVSPANIPPPRPYRVAAIDRIGGFASSSASVEFETDFPEVPLRLPHITELEEDESSSDTEHEPVAGDSAEPSDESGSSQEPATKQEVSVERLLEIVDPESYLLPLAPVFFLPVPWKEATEAPFESRFDDLYGKFQTAVKKGAGWREVVEEAVSAVRRDPSHQSGYFLFLLGAQLEKSGYLHVADVCLATAIECLESGSAHGAACHLAGRVSGRRGELGRALEYFERAAELAGEAELAVLKIDASECHLGMGRPEEALLGFEEVFDYLAANAPKVQALAVQAKMAQIHLLIGDPDTSQALAEQTRASLSPKNAGTYRVLGRILLSRAFARLGRLELALELAENAWEGAQQWSAKRKDGRRIAISNLVDIYCLAGRFEDAHELIAESGLTGWGLAEAELLLRAGHISCALGNLDHARKYLRLGKSFLTRFRSPALWRSCFYELDAEIYLREGDYLKAHLISEKALKVFEREATGPVDRSRHIVRSAKIMAALGEIDEARDLLEQAYALRDLHLGAEHPHTSSVEGLTAILS